MFTWLVDTFSADLKNNLLKKILVETKTLQKTPITLHIKNITKHYPLKRIIKIIKNN